MITVVARPASPIPVTLSAKVSAEGKGVVACFCHTVGSAWKTPLKAHSVLSRVSASLCDLPLSLSLVAPRFLCSLWCLSIQDGNSQAISGFDVLMTTVLVGRMSEAGVHPPS